MKLTQKQKLEIGAYVVTIALAFPLYFLATKYEDSTLGDFLLNISATLAGAGFLFFLLNRFFGIEFEIGDGFEKEISAERFFKTDFFYDLKERVSKAKSVRVNGFSLTRTSNSFLIPFQACIKNGGSVNVIMIDPNKESVLELSSRRSFRRQNLDKLQRECMIALDNFETLWEGSGQNKEKFEVRLCHAIPSFGIWVIDEESRSAEIWVIFYSFRGEVNPKLRLTPHKDGVWFDFFKNQFEILWQDSKPWK